MSKQVVKKALIACIPVMAGYIVLGIGFGLLLQKSGYGVFWALAMSLFIYAGSMQYVGVSLITGGASLITTALTTLAVNARHLFYSISMINVYKDAGKKKPYLVFALTDETYSLLCGGTVPAGEDPQTYRFLVSLFNQCFWVTGSVIGALVGKALPFGTEGIEFSMTALFAASMTEQWSRTKDHIPALTGLAASIICLVIFGPSNFLIPSMLSITFVLTIIRKRIEGTPSEEKS